VWLQNIDSRDLVWKFFGLNILQRFERLSIRRGKLPLRDEGLYEPKARRIATAQCKQKGLRVAQPRVFNSLLLL
jgi:hypothetical protein